ncbi:MAG: thioether cross-link-forming SCIFF peptide maturase [Oscillospiraceae bacterium]|jgi:uncharacterized protein|nr:thioether cross-link-forming SCIFF peptide maturase [Oscillospiraceae bacterium]
MIHKYKLNNYNILIDVNSGAVHIIDDICFDMLSIINKENLYTYPEDKLINQFSNKYAKQDILETYQEVQTMFEKDQLFTNDLFGGESIKNKIVNSPIKAMCINIAHDCNLKCEYCFAAKGDFGYKKELMPLDTAKKAIDFLINNSGDRHNLEVDFFGGEPLMNFNVVKETIEYARSIEKKSGKNFRFTITTNGMLLDDEKINFINKEMHNVVLSLDGRKNINDKLRLTKSGKSSYEIIVPKYQKLVKSRKDKDYYVRGTFTKNNLDFSKDVMHMYELGFENISVEPVVSDSHLSYSIKEENLDKIFQEYEILAKKIIELRQKNKKIIFFHFMIDLEKSPCAVKKLKGCGCGNEYVAVTPSGDIYPCHQFVGKEQFKMGNLNDNTLNLPLKNKFSLNNIYSKDECIKCWAKYFCSGGCSANNFNFEQNINTPHKISCALQKKRLECAIMIKAWVKLQNN